MIKVYKNCVFIVTCLRTNLSFAEKAMKNLAFPSLAVYTSKKKTRGEYLLRVVISGGVTVPAKKIEDLRSSGKIESSAFHRLSVLKKEHQTIEKKKLSIVSKLQQWFPEDVWSEIIEFDYEFDIEAVVEDAARMDDSEDCYEVVHV